MLVLALSTSLDLDSSKLVVLTLDHKFRPSAGRARAALQLPIGQSGWFTGFVDPMLQLF